MADGTITPSIACPAPSLPAGAQGIARVAVEDGGGRLTVTFHSPVTPGQSYLYESRSYTLTGGQRLFPRVVTATPGPGDPRQVSLTLDGPGDFSIYALTVSGPDIDPFFASYKLRFRIGCDDPFDCRPPAPAAAEAAELPVVIDYLAKDYSSFRQALLDFIPTRLPAWTERSEADLGMMLLELFAATADHLSYMQDRIANEAFLETATQRRSVAGHLALIGYRLDEGASASTWLHFSVKDQETVALAPGAVQVASVCKSADEPEIVFETLSPATLHLQHNEMSLYTWGNRGCCLPRTALSAELDRKYEDLERGDYLLFDSGEQRRDLVRLTQRPEFIARPGSPPQWLTAVRWSEATPLRFDHPADSVKVRGNLVRAGHGQAVAAQEVLRPEGQASGPSRLRLRLGGAPLSRVDQLSSLRVYVDGELWQERPSLLDSRGDDHHYRVEMDDAGPATVVFGDNTFGQRPPDAARITATYRVGAGRTGNVSAGTLTRVESAPNWLDSVTNPLPATGGRDPEPRRRAVQMAPAGFRQPLVSVTEGDYQAAVQSFTDAQGVRRVQRAKARFRWTGSWLTVMITADPVGSQTLSDDLHRELLDYLRTRRLAGYDLEIVSPNYVPVDLEIEFCPAPGFRAVDVRQALHASLASSGTGFFHPDNFSFGDNLHVSRIYAAVMAAPGVESARIARLARLNVGDPKRATEINLRQGLLAAGADEIIRLDNDRNAPENGRLVVRPARRAT